MASKNRRASVRVSRSVQRRRRVEEDSAPSGAERERAPSSETLRAGIEAIAAPGADRSRAALGAATMPRLQQTFGNQAVQRLMLQRQSAAVQRDGAEEEVQTQRAPVQRFAFENPDWSAATKGKRSGSGMGGVLFFEDGTPEPLVVKKSNDPVGESLLMGTMQDKISKGKGAKVPKTRAPSQGEKNSIAQTSERLIGDWRDDDDKDSWLTAMREGGSNIFVMGKAQGKEFKDVANQEPIEATAYLNQPTYCYQMGMAHAVDMFLGNMDRFLAMNLGNWMSAYGDIALIDNFDRFGAQYLVGNKINPDGWKESCLPELVNPQKAGQDAYTNLLRMLEQQPGAGLVREFVSEQIFVSNFAKGVKDGRSRILSKLAPRLGRRSRTVKGQVMGTFEEGGKAWAEIKRRAKVVRSKS